VSLADIPAELIKAVNVYKTRTADQVEGGIAGTVNVELRRPIDLKKGLTIAGSMRGAYDSQSDKLSKFSSLLLSDRFSTGIGDIGILLNVAYQD
jgi:outer membrane receptor protein involved in Fe transport